MCHTQVHNCIYYIRYFVHSPSQYLFGIFFFHFAYVVVRVFVRLVDTWSEGLLASHYTLRICATIVLLKKKTAHSAREWTWLLTQLKLEIHTRCAWVSDHFLFIRFFFLFAVDRWFFFIVYGLLFVVLLRSSPSTPTHSIYCSIKDTCTMDNITNNNAPN